MLTQNGIAQIQKILDQMETRIGPLTVYEVYHRDEYHPDITTTDKLFSSRAAAVRYIEREWNGKQVSWSQDSWKSRHWTFYIAERRVED